MRMLSPLSNSELRLVIGRSEQCSRLKSLKGKRTRDALEMLNKMIKDGNLVVKLDMAGGRGRKQMETRENWKKMPKWCLWS